MATTPPGEFSGHQQRNTIAPPLTPAGTPGHVPENFEKLRLVYLTGQHEDSTALPIEGVMEGLLPIDVAEEAMPVHPLYFEV